MSSFFPHAQATFTAPASGIGPNRYVTRNGLFAMIGIAFLCHILFLIIADILPDDEVKQVPVRALNLKLGDAESGLGVRIIPRFTPPPEIAKTPATPQPAKPAATPKAQAVQPALPEPKRVNVQNALQSQEKKRPKQNPALSPRKQPAEQTTPLTAPKLEAPKPAPVPAPLLKLPAPAPQPIATAAPAPASTSVPIPAPAAIATTPQKFVREQGGEPAAHPGIGQDAQGQTSSTNEEEILKRYEQLLSLWIKKHQIYPDSAKAQRLTGKPIVRIRIDRQGNVRFSSIEKPTKHLVLNHAAMEMIKRANPVPPVPSDYPKSGQLLEFLVPVSFTP